MSIRTATMNNPYSPATPRPAVLPRLLGTLLYVAAISGLMALLYVHQKNLSRFWMTVFATLSIGLASGSIARMLFFHRSGFLRFFAILLNVPLGLFLLGILTLWDMGIGPLNPWVKGIIPQDELIQLGGAFLIAFIALEAWWKPLSKIKEVADSYHAPRSREQAPLPIVARPVAQPRQEHHVQESLSLQPKKISHLKFMKASKPNRRNKSSAVDNLFSGHTARPARSKRKGLFSSKPNLQISMYEEHRCPFCLEEVKRNDPRGVKKCEVCNTLHHADCWAITGMCQVPHLNT